MASLGEIKITVVDEATPVIRRITRELWWMQFGGRVVVAVLVIALVAVFLSGFLIGEVIQRLEPQSDAKLTRTGESSLSAGGSLWMPTSTGTARSI